MNVETLANLLDETLVVDVRSPAEFHEGHIPGALLLPLDHLLAELPTLQTIETPLVLACDDGLRAREAESRLAAAGLLAHVLEGGLAAWRAKSLPVEH